MAASNLQQEEAHRAVDVAVGLRIRHCRLAKGLTQSEVARAAGVSFQQMQKYEKGENRVAASRLMAIADVLEVPASQLLGEGRAPVWSTAPITTDELRLLSDYRASPVATREIIRRIAALLKAEAEGDPAPTD